MSNFGPPPIFMFFFVTIFVLVIGVFVVGIGKGIMQWSENNRQPMLTVPIKIVTKRTNVTISSDCNNADSNFHHHGTSSSTTYFATFEFSSGDRKEFSVTAAEYGLLVEGDEGDLTFQGTRYKSFQRRESSNKVEVPSSISVAALVKGEVGQQSSEHSFCPYCGVQVDGEFRFCPHCGKAQPVYESQC